MKRLFTSLTLLLAFAALQGETLKDISISLWPDYDHPGVLVMLEGILPAETGLPATVTFPVPGDVSRVLTMGTTLNPDSSVAFQTRENSVTLTLLHHSFHLEYYTHTFSSDSRDMDFSLFTPYDVTDSCDIFIQKPLAAKDFKLSFTADETQNDRHGLEYHVKHLGTQKKGNLIKAGFSYTNPDGKLSIDVLQEMMSQMGNTTTGGSTAQPESSFPTWMWFLVVIIVILIAALSVILTRSGTPVTASTAGSAGKFCGNCGSAREAGHRFCPKCGHKY